MCGQETLWLTLAVGNINWHWFFRGQFGHVYENKKCACSQIQQWQNLEISQREMVTRGHERAFQGASLPPSGISHAHARVHVRANTHTLTQVMSWSKCTYIGTAAEIPDCGILCSIKKRHIYRHQGLQDIPLSRKMHVAEPYLQTDTIYLKTNKIVEQNYLLNMCTKRCLSETHRKRLGVHSLIQTVKNGFL